MHGDREAKFSGTALVRPDLYQCYWEGCRCLGRKLSTGHRDATVRVSFYTPSICTAQESEFQILLPGHVLFKTNFFFFLSCHFSSLILTAPVVGWGVAGWYVDCALVGAHLWYIGLHKRSCSTSEQLHNVTNKAFGYSYFLRAVGQKWTQAHLQNLRFAWETSLSILP